jgi:hypothetical protein
MDYLIFINHQDYNRIILQIDYYLNEVEYLNQYLFDVFVIFIYLEHDQ